MVTKKQKEQAQARNQILLSFLFMIMMIGNFVTVAGITWYYENNGHENIVEIYRTDSNTDFGHVNYGVSFPVNHFDNYTSGYYHLAPSTTTWLTYEKAPTYLGNDTWGISINATTHANANAFTIINIDLPDLNQWIITDIDINTTLPGDTDQELFVATYSKNTPIEITDGNLDTTLLLDASIPGLTELDEHIDVSPVNSLRIQENSKVRVNDGLHIRIRDTTNNGMGSFAFQFKVVILGTQAGGWTLQTSLLISTTIWNILILIGVIYSLDMFDVGGFVKTIKEKRRS